MTFKVVEEPALGVAGQEEAHAYYDEHGDTWILSPELMAWLRRVHIGEAKLKEVSS